VFNGNGGNNRFIFSLGNDYLDGSSRNDTINCPTLRRQHSVSMSNSDVHINETTTHSVERVQFFDGTLATSVYDTAAQVYRLYNAVLDRNPDNAGLKN
jgi:serralysin